MTYIYKDVHSAVLSNIVLEVLAKVIRQTKEMKSIQIKREVKWSQFRDDMILNAENPKNAPPKKPDRINKFNKVAGYKKSKYQKKPSCVSLYQQWSI